ncbi:tRNA (Adenosine(37)-N6)-threonylcarbamoyltransferase complex dimerization subunit type 1 TsaB [Candidatus Desulfarcum epimagneticum]|uniref:tRNA (Adenosine(37)-N6)-threonylcarbamoyltransferase complex dimerization subunit type 1 TsaB n=1 Tax=uncultured Desulfobacteraceae bacterium TaxID=218296 RepID=A0A484HJB4_9BACT|nr:tRNA (Adenosine(37)-N6)-threonylcarbamoyltransferase complex dimerization subunit type 1 TsaB [uncultured Desulfobacteraceae bacterium]
MKILAADTGTNICSVAVCGDGEILAEISANTRQTHSRHLLRLVRQALDMAGLSISEIDAFAAATGPGSFTGLRIGVASIQGLAAASGKPAAGIPSLKALAWQAPFASGRVIPFVEAGRGEVFFRLCRFADSGLETLQDDAVMPPGKALEGLTGPCFFIGNAALRRRGLIEKTLGEAAFFPPSCHHHLRPSTLAFLAREKIQKQKGPGPGPLAPRYVRKPDAEVKRRLLEPGFRVPDGP